MNKFLCVLATILSCVNAFSKTSITHVAKSSSALNAKAAEGMSRSLPFCKKPKNLDGMIVSDLKKKFNVFIGLFIFLSCSIYNPCIPYMNRLTSCSNLSN